MPHRSALAVIGAALAALTFSQPAGAATPGNPPGPAFPRDGLRVVAAKGGAVLRFTGASAKVGRAWRGERLEVTCETVAQDSSAGGGFVDAPAAKRFNGRSLRLRVETGSDYCAVRHPDADGHGSRLVAVAPVSAAGRTWVTDLGYATGLLSFPMPDTTPPGRVPTIDEMLAENDHLRTLDGKPLSEPFIVALSGPDAAPPASKLGYWSDGRRHDVLALLSPTGHRLFVENDADDVVRSNILRFAFFLEGD